MFRIEFFLTFAVVYVISGASSNVIHKSKTQTKQTRLRSLVYEDCGSQYDIVYLSISSCTSIPCQMARGSNILVHTIFDDYGSNTQFLKHSVRWIFNAVKTGATITPDPCDGIDECISNDAEGKSYWATVYVNNTLPVMRGTMLWEAKASDEDTINLLCFKIPVTITVAY